MSATTACTSLLRRSDVADLAERPATITSPVPGCENTMRPPACWTWAVSDADGLPGAASSMRYRGAAGSVASTARVPCGATGVMSEQAASTLAVPAAATSTSRRQTCAARQPRIPHMVVIPSKLRGCTHAVKPLYQVRRGVVTARHVSPPVSCPVPSVNFCGGVRSADRPAPDHSPQVLCPDTLHVSPHNSPQSSPGSSHDPLANGGSPWHTWPEVTDH